MLEDCAVAGQKKKWASDMTHIEIRSKADASGVLNLRIPLGVSAANQEVQVIVESIDTEKASPPMTQGQWKALVAEMAGGISDPTFVRHDQGELRTD